MSKKLYGLLLPVLAVAAFGSLSAVAQAAPHWQVCTNTAAKKEFKTHACKPGETGTAFGWENLPFTGARSEVITSSPALSLKLASGAVITCTVKDKGFIWNNTSGEGKDEVTVFTNEKCEAAPESACPMPELVANPTHLPWPTHLIEEVGPPVVIRDVIEEIHIEVICGGSKVAEFAGTLSPEMSTVNGTATFNTSAGSLTKVGGTEKATASGEDSITLANGWAVRVHS